MAIFSCGIEHTHPYWKYLTVLSSERTNFLDPETFFLNIIDHNAKIIVVENTHKKFVKLGTYIFLHLKIIEKNILKIR